MHMKKREKRLPRRYVINAEEEKKKRKSRSPFKPALFSVHSLVLTPLTAAGLALRTMICWTSRQVRF